MREQITKRLIKSNKAQAVSTEASAKDADAYTIGLSVDAPLLMENAGKAVADAVLALIAEHSKKTRILIFIGPGNNGADAVVTARHLLAKNLKLSLYAIGDEKFFGKDLAYQVSLFKQIVKLTKNNQKLITYVDSQQSLTIKQKPSFTIIVDGIFGAGLNRLPSGPALLAIQAINRYKKDNPKQTAIVSIDVPSGLTLEARSPMGDCVRADHTITFGNLKRVHISEPTKALCGKCVAKDIGLFNNQKPTNFWIFRQKTLHQLFSPVTKASHKGQFGHVLVLEGDDRFLGASRLSARAALRVGAGLATIATKKDSKPSVLDLPEFMRCKAADISSQVLNKIDTLVLGPGLGNDETAVAMEILNNLPDRIKSIVVDADGLKLLTDQALTLTKKCIIATPHAKEASRLLGCDTETIEKDRFLAIESLAHIKPGIECEVIWVLKGATTLVRDIDGCIFAFRGDLPILSAGGSGDVLAGAIAGLIKQTPSPLSAALLAVSLQIEAAKILSKSIFKGSLASELADLFPLLTKKRPLRD